MFAVIIEDRHSDPEIVLYHSREAARERAMEIFKDMANEVSEVINPDTFILGNWRNSISVVDVGYPEDGPLPESEKPV